MRIARIILECLVEHDQQKFGDSAGITNRTRKQSAIYYIFIFIETRKISALRAAFFLAPGEGCSLRLQTVRPFDPSFPPFFLDFPADFFGNFFLIIFFQKFFFGKFFTGHFYSGQFFGEIFWGTFF